MLSLLGALAAATSGTMAVAQTLLVRFITLGVNLLSGVISARYLGPVGRAEQAAILLGAGLFPFILSFGIPLAIQYNVRTDPELESEYVSAGTALAIALGILAAVVGFFVLPQMLGKYPPTIILAARCAMLIAPVTMLYMLLSSILQARGRFRETNFTRYAMPASTVIILIALILSHRLNPISSSIAYLVTGLWAVPLLWVKVKPILRLRGFKKAAKGLLSYGSRSYVSDILGTLASQVDQVLVIGLLNPTSMGFYAVAIGAARTVDLYSSSVVAVLFPRASSLSTDQIIALTARAARLTFAMLLVTMIALIVLMPIVLPLAFGRAFVQSVPIARVIVVSFALNGLVYVLAQAFMAAGRPGIVAIIQLCGLATTVPAMFLLIPRYGLLGAAIALVISTLVRFFSLLACFRFILKAPIPSLVLNAGDIAFLRGSLGRHSRSTD
jgi:O-antigen/teichoic acid export membrane protein